MAIVALLFVSLAVVCIGPASASKAARLCADVDKDTQVDMLPSFALASSAEEFVSGQEAEKAKLKQ